MIISLKKANSEQRILDDCWATGIKARDNWTCQVCGTDFKVVAHHIIPRENKQFRYCSDNGISLCLKCHKFSRIISAHNNPLAFFVWLQSFRTHLFFAATERTKQLLLENGIEIR